MIRRFKTIVLVLALFASSGCASNVAGSWEVVDVRPHGASFPFNRVVLDEHGKYTATGLYDENGRMSDEVRTTTGQAEHKGNNLRLLPTKGTPVAYKARRRLDGKMELTLRVPGQDRPLTAVLARTEK